MNTKKYLLVVALLVAFVALAGLGADVAQARGKFAPHPPQCVKIISSEHYTLQCTDTGKDIVGVEVKSDAKYDLEWDATAVTVRLYPDPANDIAFLNWTVIDDAGSSVSGTLP